VKFKEQKIQGVFLIDHEPFSDNRGKFERHFCGKEYEDAGINPGICQTNLSYNTCKGTLRGFHYQKPPHSECKTISCLKGEIYDIVVDLRPDSKTYMAWQSFTLDETQHSSLYISGGCANAFLTMKDNTVILYYMSEYFTPDSYCGFRYDDPFFKFDWPEEPSIISVKDESYENFITN
jgi:dTDP-4-dehydrorhamnose 3,5-epimerase